MNAFGWSCEIGRKPSKVDAVAAVNVTRLRLWHVRQTHLVFTKDLSKRVESLESFFFVLRPYKRDKSSVNKSVIESCVVIDASEKFKISRFAVLDDLRSGALKPEKWSQKKKSSHFATKWTRGSQKTKKN